MHISSCSVKVFLAHELDSSSLMDCNCTCLFTTNGLIFVSVTAYGAVFVRTEGDTVRKFGFCVLPLTTYYVC
jgi:hypothetical protein